MEYVHRLREAARVIMPETGYALVSKKEAKALAKEDGTREAVPEEQVQKENEIYTNVVDRFIFRFFLNGLREELKVTVLNSETTNLQDAIVIAEKREHYLKTFRDDAEYVNYMSALSPVDDPVVAQAEQQLKDLNIRAAARTPQQTPKAEATTTREPLLCFWCGQPGHFKRECPARRPYRPNSWSNRDNRPANRSNWRMDNGGAQQQHQRNHESHGNQSGEYRHPNFPRSSLYPQEQSSSLARVDHFNPRSRQMQREQAPPPQFQLNYHARNGPPGRPPGQRSVPIPRPLPKNGRRPLHRPRV